MKLQIITQAKIDFLEKSIQSLWALTGSTERRELTGLIADSKCAEIDIAMHTSQEQSTNVELENEHAIGNKLRELGRVNAPVPAPT